MSEASAQPQNPPHIRTVAVVVPVGVIMDLDTTTGLATIKGLRPWVGSVSVEEPTWSTGRPGASVTLAIPGDEIEALDAMKPPPRHFQGWETPGSFCQWAADVGLASLVHLDAIPERQATSCQATEEAPG